MIESPGQIAFYRSTHPAGSGEAGVELYSVTLTLNWNPVEALRIAPEVRWDHATMDDAFDGEQDQITLGLGAAYSF